MSRNTPSIFSLYTTLLPTFLYNEIENKNWILKSEGSTNVETTAETQLPWIKSLVTNHKVLKSCLFEIELIAQTFHLSLNLCLVLDLITPQYKLINEEYYTD